MTDDKIEEKFLKRRLVKYDTKLKRYVYTSAGRRLKKILDKQGWEDTSGRSWFGYFKLPFDVLERQTNVL
jgi:hypothetical protein